MKIIRLTLAFCLIAVSVFAQKNPFASDILTEAFAKAKKENKNVFVKFEASWCGWCKKMDASMNDAACKKFFDDNFIIAKLVVDEAKDKLDLETPGADSVRTQYNGEKSAGLPFWFVLDANGKLLADCYLPASETDENKKRLNIGCPAKEEEVLAFIEVLKKTTRLSDSELQIISEIFRKNEVKSR